MTTVSSLGTGSGLELEALVTKLMAVEQQPLTRLQEKEADIETKISALGTLQSSLESLQTSVSGMVLSTGETAADKFSSFDASSSSETVATATATTGAVAGSHSLSVTSIATAQQIRKSGISVPSAAGTLSIQVGSGSSVSVSIDAGSSLDDVATAINDSDAGVTATIITSGSTSYLSITTTDTGADNTITITGSDTDDSTGTAWSSAFDYSSSTANSWTEQVAAADASLTIDGVSVTSDSNTLTNISGLTVTLVAAGDTTLTVTQDTSTTINTLLEGFVSAYNLSNTSMSELGAYDAETEEAGDLQGDSTLRNAKTQIRSLLFSVSTGGTSAYQTLSDIGISVQDDGSLEIDSDKLSAAISADFTAVSTLIAKVGDAFDTTLDGIVGDDGSVVTATENLNDQIDTLNDRETALSDRLETIEATYRAKFTALDTLISSLNSTSTYLTQFFASESSSS